MFGVPAARRREAGDPGDQRVDQESETPVEVVGQAEAAAQFEDDETVDAAAQHPDRIRRQVSGQVEPAERTGEHGDRLGAPGGQFRIRRVGEVGRDLRGCVATRMRVREAAQSIRRCAQRLRARTTDRRCREHPGQFADRFGRDQATKVRKRPDMLVQARDGDT